MLRRLTFSTCASAAAASSSVRFATTEASSASSSSAKPYTAVSKTKLRYDLMGPRSMNHIRLNRMSTTEFSNTNLTTRDDDTGAVSGEPKLRWVEDPKNWAELNQQDWADADKNAKKNFVMPRMFQ